MRRQDMRYGPIKIFAGNAGNILAEKICQRLSISLSKANVSRFKDGEVRVEILENVRDCDVFIINPTNPPAENLMEMLILADAIRGSSARRITLVPTILGYNRQDRKDKPRAPLSARLICQMLSLVKPNRALLMDLHSEPTMGFFDNSIIVDHLYASLVAVPELKKIINKNTIVASPDKGGTTRAEAYAKRLGLSDCVVFYKHRPNPNEVDTSSIKIIGDVKGCDILFVDDIIDTGNTIINDAVAAKKAGAKNIYVFVTHGVLSGDAIKNLNKSLIKKIFITDSIYHNNRITKSNSKIQTISVAPLLAQAIQRIHEGKSVSSLIS